MSMTQERMGEIISRATAEIEKDAKVIASQKRRIEDLGRALSSIISTWDEPGPMGTLYAMPRAISYAKSVLDREPWHD